MSLQEELAPSDYRPMPLHSELTVQPRPQRTERDDEALFLKCSSSVRVGARAA
jgi:hypothetical protein